uniref:Uncharacterized protein n=1 Tax=Cyprinus carpio carpio TaxID=630221 RepID=A0A9J7XPJ1_CYPCA
MLNNCIWTTINQKPTNYQNCVKLMHNFILNNVCVCLLACSPFWMCLTVIHTSRLAKTTSEALMCLNPGNRCLQL